MKGINISKFSKPIILAVFMLVLMLILPPLFGGQVMIWWSTVWARILSAVLAVVLKRYVDRKEMQCLRHNRT